MRKIKSLLLIILTIILLIGGNGCMNQIDKIKSEGSKLILNHLSSKYQNSDFKIVDLYREVDGSNGSYYRAVCVNTKFENEKFVTYAYLNGSNYVLDEIDEIKEIETDNEITFIDDYANIVIAHQYQDVIQNIVGDDYIVRCNIILVDSYYEFSAEEINQGFDYCISIPEKDVHVKIFIFTQADDANINDLSSFVIDEAKKHNAYGQYIYICSYENATEQTILNDYYDNYNKYDTYARYYAEYINKIEYIAVKKDTLNIDRKYIKE